MRGLHSWSGMLGLALGAVLTLIFLRLPRPHVTWYDSVISRVPVTEKLVALTYDDGPHPVFTPRLLEILSRYHVKATFFMIGTQMERYPEVVREVAAEGHVVGNHTFSHPYNISHYDEPRILHEIEREEQEIESLTGSRAQLFRPPRGLLDGAVFAAADRAGYRTILWTISADHHDAPSARDMTARVTRLVQPGSILLLHDGTTAARIKDVEATPLIIEALQRQGYRFVTIPDLLAHAARQRAEHPAERDA